MELLGEIFLVIEHEEQNFVEDEELDAESFRERLNKIRCFAIAY